MKKISMPFFTMFFSKKVIKGERGIVLHLLKKNFNSSKKIQYRWVSLSIVDVSVSIILFLFWFFVDSFFQNFLDVSIGDKFTTFQPLPSVRFSKANSGVISSVPTWPGIFNSFVVQSITVLRTLRIWRCGDYSHLGFDNHRWNSLCNIIPSYSEEFLFP